MKRILATSVVLLAIVVPSVVAQQSGGSSGQDGARTIEELYLSQELELQILRGQALSDDREMKELALQDIRAMVEDGSVTGGNEGVYVILEALATEGTSRQIRSGGRVVNNYPEIRRESVELLGKVGGERAKDSLLRVLTDDPEPMVLAEAAYGLGTIGLNPDNEVSDQIVQILHRTNTSATPDSNLAFACVLALERLSANTGGLPDPEVINVLLETAGGSYIRAVRVRAVQAIVNMRDDG